MSPLLLRGAWRPRVSACSPHRARGCRPANRRDLILDAATSLFAGQGFANISMSDIAQLVDVRPSALYRHFAGKEDLLRAAVDRALDELERALNGAAAERADDRSKVLVRVAAFSADNRSAALLWEREARHLPPLNSGEVRQRLDDLRESFARTVSPADATTYACHLAARMALAILLSPAFHHVDLSDSSSRAALVQTATAVLDAHVAAPPSSKPRPVWSGLGRATKREQILRAALRIFAEQTYASAGMEQIAAAVDMSASSLYNYFASKAEILQIALQRGNGYLQVTLDDILRDAVDPASALRDVVGVYTSFALRHPGMVDALVTESGGPGNDALLLQAQREYVGEWIQLGAAAKPGQPAKAAAIAVQGVLAAINEVARTYGSPATWAPSRSWPSSRRRHCESDIDSWRGRDLDPRPLDKLSGLPVASDRSGNSRIACTNAVSAVSNTSDFNRTTQGRAD